MASTAPITGAPAGASGISINGVSFMNDDPEHFMEQAHAMACCLEAAYSEDVGLRSDILQSGIGAVVTLVHLAYSALNDERFEVVSSSWTVWRLS